MPKKDLQWVKELRRDTSINVIRIGVGSSASVQLLGPNPKRKAIIFTPSTSTTYTVSWDSSVTSGQGLTFSIGTNPYIISDQDIGSAITMPIFAIANSTGRTVTVYEVIYNDGNDNRWDSDYQS